MNTGNYNQSSENSDAPVTKDCYVTLQQMCRVCMNCDKNLDVTNVFKYNNYFQDNLSNILYQCTGVDIKKSDNLPIFICTICVSALKVAWNLKKKCNSSFGKFSCAEEEYGDAIDDTENLNNSEYSKQIFLNNFKNKRKQCSTFINIDDNILFGSNIYNKAINNNEVAITKALQWMEKRKNVRNPRKKRKVQ